jgi:hypothetical protein
LLAEVVDRKLDQANRLMPMHQSLHLVATELERLAHQHQEQVAQMVVVAVRQQPTIAVAAVVDFSPMVPPTHKWITVAAPHM